MNHNQLIKKSGLYLIGNLSSKILTVLILPIYALYLTPNSLGYFDYSQTIINVLIPLMYLAIWEAILKFILSAKDIEETNKVISTSLFFVVCLSVIFMLAAVLIDNIFRIENIYYITFMLLSQGIAQIWQYYARSLKENKIFVMSSILSTLINFIFVVILVILLKFSLSGLYIAYILGQLSIFLVIELKLKLFIKMEFSKVDMKKLIEMVKFSFPLSFNLISAWFMSGYARFFITNYFGVFENGLYSFANKFSQILNVFGTVIVMAMIEEAIVAKNDSDFSLKFTNIINNICKLFIYSIYLLLPIIVVFYNLLDNNDFANSINYVPLLLLYTVFMILSSAVGVVFQVVEKTKYQFFTTLLGAITTIGLSFILSFTGIHSIVIAQVLGAIVLFVSRYILGKQYVNIKLNYKFIMVLTVIYILFSSILIESSMILNLVYLLVLFLVLGAIYRKELKSMIYFFKKKVKGR